MKSWPWKRIKDENLTFCAWPMRLKVSRSAHSATSILRGQEERTEVWRKSSGAVQGRLESASHPASGHFKDWETRGYRETSGHEKWENPTVLDITSLRAQPLQSARAKRTEAMAEEEAGPLWLLLLPCQLLGGRTRWWQWYHRLLSTCLWWCTHHRYINSANIDVGSLPFFSGRALIISSVSFASQPPSLCVINV